MHTSLFYYIVKNHRQQKKWHVLFLFFVRRFLGARASEWSWELWPTMLQKELVIRIPTAVALLLSCVHTLSLAPFMAFTDIHSACRCRNTSPFTRQKSEQKLKGRMKWIMQYTRHEIDGFFCCGTNREWEPSQSLTYYCVEHKIVHTSTIHQSEV